MHAPPQNITGVEQTHVSQNLDSPTHQLGMRLVHPVLALHPKAPAASTSTVARTACTQPIRSCPLDGRHNCYWTHDLSDFIEMVIETLYRMCLVGHALSKKQLASLAT